MKQPVLLIADLAEVGIVLRENLYIHSQSADEHILTRMLKHKAVWLDRGPKGELIGYDPETQIQIGTRIVLNDGGDVKPEHISWGNLRGLPEWDMPELVTTSMETLIANIAHSWSFVVQSTHERGWTMGVDDDGKPVALCQNNVFIVEQLVRHAR